jgi:hypothetical protein
MLEGGDGVCGVSRYEYVMIECGEVKVGWEMGDKIRKAREADGAFVVTILCLHARWAHHKTTTSPVLCYAAGRVGFGVGIFWFSAPSRWCIWKAAGRHRVYRTPEVNKRPCFESIRARIINMTSQFEDT